MCFRYCSVCLSAVLLTYGLFVSDMLAGDQLELVEQVRGGRHWVDAETAPPLSPEESWKRFQVEPGVRVELFAAEPLVKDPVALAFDELGRMFVAEYGDYPIGPKDGEKYLSRVVLLEDTDNDNQADKRTVFADNLKFAHSLMPYRGGLLVCAQTDILFLRDTDGDNIADQRTTLYSGFQPAHPQMQIGNPRWGIDNWIYLNYGPGSITRAEDGKQVKMPRSEFRMHPVTSDFGPASGLGQYGNTIDRWGRRFFCTNRNPVIAAVMPLEVARRNPFQSAINTQYDVAAAGGDAKVFPLIAMKSNYLSHAGTHTAACGTTAYLGNQFDASFRESVFVCEPIGHLVTRSVVRSNGVELTAERARPEADFLASTDPWFRPSSLANGPDGSLYLADMYRLWVEHPKFLPDEIAAKLDWRAGEDRGRIWRIVPENDDRQPVAFTPPATGEDLVELLKSYSGWQRFLGQRLIVERQLRELAPKLRTVLVESEQPEPRLHALWTLAGIDALTKADLVTAFHDPHPAVRSAGLSLSAEYLQGEDSELLVAICKLASEPDISVRYELLLTLGNTASNEIDQTLVAVTLADGNDPRIREALLTGAAERSGRLLTLFLDDENFRASSSEWKRDLVRNLSQIVGHRGEANEVKLLLEMAGAESDRTRWIPFAVLSGLSDGLSRGRNARYLSLTALLKSPPEGWGEVTQQLRMVMEQASRTATDPGTPVDQRLAAVELLSRNRNETTQETLLILLDPAESPQIREAALENLGNYATAEVARAITSRWQTFSPALQSQAMRLLLRRAEQIQVVLEEMAAKRVPASVVDLDQRVRLLQNRDESISKLARQVFGDAVSSNRRQVVDEYRAAMEQTGDIQAGRMLFEKHCQKCHRRNGVGESLGPDISDLANRPTDAVLFDILDPNSKVEPRFNEYVVVEASGLLHHGIITTETESTLVLTQPGGKTVEVSRAEIDELQNTGRSLMPEGLEKELSVADMADLLEFLQQ